MPRFFVTSPLETGTVVALPDDVVRHIQVLRLQPGDTLTLFSGRGGEYAAELVSVEKRQAVARITEFSDREIEPPYRIILAQGVASGDKMDWLIEKAVELGMHAVQPLISEKCVVRLSGERAQRRVAHWQSLAQAACEQCGRNRVPDVFPVMPFHSWLAGISQESQLRLLLSPRGTTGFEDLPPLAPQTPAVLLIGPEGGLSEDEEDAAVAAGFAGLQLGERVLRTETAGIALLAALAARWGGW